MKKLDSSDSRLSQKSFKKKKKMKELHSLNSSDPKMLQEHSKLIQAVTQLDKKQRVQISERDEPSSTISEFHLVKSGITDADAIEISDLVKNLGQKGYQTKTAKLFNTTKSKCKVLPKVLEKHTLEKVKREIGFDNLKKELQKWNDVVAQNRIAEHVSFPLNYEYVKSEPTNKSTKRFRIQSDLEKDLNMLEEKSENVEEENDLKISLEEILQRRAEIAKTRAQQSYKISKDHRRKKIKSKKFHRIEKKSKQKNQLKELEQLEKNNPLEASEKLKFLDKVRSEERMTLRHKNTGHWARNKLIRAKHDKECRQELSQQLSIGRDLTQKISNTEDMDDEEETTTPLPVSQTFTENRWINMKPASEVEQLVSQYHEHCNNKTNKGAKRKNVIPPVPCEPKIQKVLGDHEDDEEPNDFRLLHEAFSDEDVVEEFKREKEQEIKKTETEDVSMILPGWGSWGGDSIKQSSKKKKQYTKKFEKDAHRKDENKGNVIIIEENNANIKKHQISELPFPFRNVKDHEASMRAPIGRNFVPEKSHRVLIRPTVKTKMGKVIEPMDEDSLLSVSNLKQIK